MFNFFEDFHEPQGGGLHSKPDMDDQNDNNQENAADELPVTNNTTSSTQCFRRFIDNICSMWNAMTLFSDAYIHAFHGGLIPLSNKDKHHMD